MINAIMHFIIIIFGKDVFLLMAIFYAQRVVLGKNSFSEVPEVLKPQVREHLEDSGLGFLADE